MPIHYHYDAISIHADDTQSINTVSTRRRLPTFLGRHKKAAQSPRRHNEAVPDSIGVDTNTDASETSTTVETAGTGKLLDLEALIDLCAIRLKLPEAQEPCDGDIEAGHSQGMVTAKRKGVAKYFKSFYKAIKSTARAALTPLKPSSIFLPLGRPQDEEIEEETEPRQRTLLSRCFLIMFRPVKSVLNMLWGETTTRVTLVPAGLVLLWIVVVSVESALLQPLRSMVDLVLPQIALAFSIVAIVGQCWVCALPFAASLASIVSQLQMLIDAAFEEMTAVVPTQISKILLKLKVPAVAADNLCKVLFSPFATVLGTIFKIIPKVDNVIPPNAKDPKPLAPFVFVGLLVGLFFAQVLLLLMMGSMLNGSIEILLGAVLCLALGWVALQAGNLIPILLKVIETVLNTVIQSLLRKLLPISKLQKTIDTAQSLIPRKPKLKRKRKNKKDDFETGESCAESVAITIDR